MSRAGMTDKEFAFEKRRFNRYIAKWKKRLRLTDWAITLVFHDNPFEVDGALNLRAAAAVPAETCLWQYLQATIKVNLAKFVGLPDEDVEETVIHELLHIIVSEMRTEGIAHEERVVSHLTNIIQGGHV